MVATSIKAGENEFSADAATARQAALRMRGCRAARGKTLFEGRTGRRLHRRRRPGEGYWVLAAGYSSTLLNMTAMV